METVILIINHNWIWLGPLLVICFGAALVWMCVDIFGGIQEEMEDGTEEWTRLRQGYGGQGVKEERVSAEGLTAAEEEHRETKRREHGAESEEPGMTAKEFKDRHKIESLVDQIGTEADSNDEESC